MQMDNPTHYDNIAETPMGQVFFWLTGQVFFFASLMVGTLNVSELAESVWTWIFRGLSALSLVLIIAINWKAGVASLKKGIKDILGKE